MKKYLILILGAFFAFVLSDNTFAIQPEILSDTLTVTAKNLEQLTLGGELRVRLEDVSTATTGLQAQEKIMQRTRLDIAADVVKNTTVFISVQDSRIWGEEATTITTGNEGQTVDISQAWFQLDNLFGQPVSLKIGRQSLQYGDGRVIGNGEWSNYARRFDAAKLMYNTKLFSFDIFYSKIADPVISTATPMPSERDAYMSGLYAAIRSIPNNTVDLYLLNDRNDDPAVQQDVYTYGARLAGKVSALDYTGELALQSGDNRLNTSQRSHAYAVKAGYTLPLAMALRIGAEYAFATGNKSSSTDKNEAFYVPYQGAHSFYGFTDDVSWTNLKAFSLSLSCKPSKNLWASAEYWDYKKSEANNTSADLGTEFNLMLRYSLNSNVKLETAWVRRTAGSGGGKDYYGRIMADGDSSDFTYLQALVTF